MSEQERAWAEQRDRLIAERDTAREALSEVLADLDKTREALTELYGARYLFGSGRTADTLRFRNAEQKARAALAADQGSEE